MNKSVDGEEAATHWITFWEQAFFFQPLLLTYLPHFLSFSCSLPLWILYKIILFNSMPQLI